MAFCMYTLIVFLTFVQPLPERLEAGKYNVYFHSVTDDSYDVVESEVSYIRDYIRLRDVTNGLVFVGEIRKDTFNFYWYPGVDILCWYEAKVVSPTLAIGHYDTSYGEFGTFYFIKQER